MVVGLMLLPSVSSRYAWAGDCKRPPPSLCENLKAQAAVRTDTRAAIGIDRARAEFEREREVTLQALSQSVADGGQQLAVACYLAADKQLACADWQSLYRRLYATPGADGTWTIDYAFHAAEPMLPEVFCEAQSDVAGVLFAETWEVSQRGDLLTVRSKAERSAQPLPFKWYAGSIDEGVLVITSDDRHGRGTCKTELRGNQLAGTCSFSSWDTQCNYQFGVSGHRSAW